MKTSSKFRRQLDDLGHRVVQVYEPGLGAGGLAPAEQPRTAVTLQGDLQLKLSPGHVFLDTTPVEIRRFRNRVPQL